MLITEYDLPRRTIAPHDVMTDAAGIAWYSNFVENTLGRLDPTHRRAHRVHVPDDQERRADRFSCANETDRERQLVARRDVPDRSGALQLKDNTFKVFALPDDLNNSRGAAVDGPAAPVARRRQSVGDRDRPPG